MRKRRVTHGVVMSILSGSALINFVQFDLAKILSEVHTLEVSPTDRLSPLLLLYVKCVTFLYLLELLL